MKSLVLLTK